MHFNFNVWMFWFCRRQKYINIFVNFTSVFAFVYASYFIISVYLTDILNYIFLTHGIGEVTGSSLFVFKLSAIIKIHNKLIKTSGIRRHFAVSWRIALKLNNGGFALTVQVSQDQQNNSFKHPETLSLNFMFSLSEARQTLWKMIDAHATPGKSPIDILYSGIILYCILY